MITIDTIIGALIAEIGTANVPFDASLINTINCGGLLVQGIQPMVDVIRALMDCYDLIVQEINGILVFKIRGSETQIIVPSVDVAAHEEGQETSRPWSITDKSSINLPREITVSFIDPSVNWVKAAQKEVSRFGLTEQSESFDFPITMTAAEARAIAKRRLWIAWTNRSEIKLTLPPKYLTLRENDLLVFTEDGESFLVRVQEINRGFNYLLEVNGIIEQSLETSFISVADDHSAPQELAPPVPVDFELIDIASFSDALINTPGYYVVAFSLNPTMAFGGASLYADYTVVVNFYTGATAGTVAGTLGTAVPGYWDRKNVLTVELTSGTLSSVTESECLAGSNRAIVGNEVIGFKTATLVADGVYELSGLLRGLLNTSDEVGSHAANERFILISSASLKFKTINSSDINIERVFRAVPTGDFFDNAIGEPLTPHAYNLRPYSPCSIKGIRDGSSNLTITWCRRTRSLVNLFTTLPVPLSEATEAYEIDVMDGSTVVRTISATSTSATYTAVQQTADGFTAGNPITVRIYQLSSVVGRGKKAEATI
jgi:hypothetical protein